MVHHYRVCYSFIPEEPSACKSQLGLLSQHLTVQVHQQTLPPKIEITKSSPRHSAEQNKDIGVHCSYSMLNPE